MARSPRLNRAQERLLRQASGDFGDGSSARGKYQAPSPEASLYGVFTPQYAAALAAPTGAAGADILNNLALRSNAEREREDYANALAAAGVLQEKLQANDAYYGFMGDIRDDNIEYTKLGMGGAEDVVMGPDGKPHIRRDPILQSVGNSLSINASVADSRKANAEALGELADIGIRTPVETAAGYMKHPLQTNPDVYGVWSQDQLTPEQSTTRYGTDQGLTYEQQLELARVKGESRDKGVQGEWSWDPVTQRYVWKVKGDIEDLQGLPGAPDATAPPPLPNPNAGAQGGGASATLAANPSAFFRDEDITSRPGKRKRPMRGASTNHAGTDYAKPEGTAIPAQDDGIVVQSGFVKGYGNRVRIRYDNGSEESYSHNQRNAVRVGDRVRRGQTIGLVGRTGTATGPHVHREIHATASRGRSQSGRNASTALALVNRAKSQGFEARILSDGNVEVTLQDGSKRKYNTQGRRVN